MVNNEEIPPQNSENSPTPRTAEFIAELLHEAEMAGCVILPIWDRINLQGGTAKRYGLSQPLPNQVYLGSNRPYNEVPVGMEFEVLFDPKNPTGYIQCRSVLKDVKVNPSYISHSVPNGYSAICLLEFLDTPPSWIGSLRLDDAPYAKGQLSLYFTTQLVMDSILRQLQSSE